MQTDNLVQAIEDASKSLEQLDKSARENTPKAGNHGGRNSVVALALVTVLLLVLKFAVFDSRRQLLENDVNRSVLDLFMEADASVLAYHAANGRLPDALPLPALAALVDYRKTGAEQYTLLVRLPPYDKPVQRSLDTTVYPTDLNSLLGIALP